MNLSRWFLITLLIPTSLQAFDYQFRCLEGNLLSFNSAETASAKECQIFLKQGFKSCFDTKRTSASQDLVYLSSPIDHYYGNKENSSYIKAKLENIIQFAVKNDLDPYLTLAITILELPPTAKASTGTSFYTAEKYENAFGLIPLDSIAVVDFMGCKAGPPIRNLVGFSRILSSPERSKVLTFNDKAKFTKFCLGNILTGNSPVFRTNCEAEMKCCVDAQIQNDDPDASCGQISDEDRRTALNMATAHYLKNRFKYAEKEKASQVSDPNLKLAMIAQSFNGYGKFGVTETSTNKCLQKMDFSKTPMYGAGAGELMLNTLMANSEIRNLVDKEVQKQNKTGPKSYLCNAYKNASEKKISAYAFSDLQRAFLENRKACPQRSYQLKGMQSATVTKENSSNAK